MPGQGRLGDQAKIDSDAHGCPGCPHPGVGPAISGSPDVYVNGAPALRQDDVGIHAVCCGANMWKANAGSGTVFINGKAAHRKNDATQHCGGSGQLIQGSDDVLVGG
ncbi:MAG TPA: PAAR domain-containing protein [Polyangia bacterium]